MNISIDDTSPQIQYISASTGWSTRHTGDNATPQYYHGTFHSTSTDGDHMSFTFNGSAIYIFGGYRSNHGLYSSQLDGGNLGYSLGYASPEKFQYPIFVSKGLDTDRSHTITLTNLPSQTSPPGNATLLWYLDIDYIIVTLPSTDKEVYTTTYDDFSPSIRYTGNWADYGAFGNGYSNNSAHVTLESGDSFGFSFNGSSVQVFGGVNENHGNYSVVLDGGLNQQFNGSDPVLHSGATLYLATNLTDGPHSLTFTSTGGGIGNSAALDFDYAVVNSTINPMQNTNSTNGTTTSSPGTGSSSGTSSKSNAGAIAGGVVGGVAALALLGFIFWFFARRKWRGEAKKNREKVDLADDHLDHPGGEITPYTDANTHPLASDGGRGPALTTGYGESELYSHSREVSAREPDQSRTPFLTTLPAPPASSNTSYPLSPAVTSTGPDTGSGPSPSPPLPPGAGVSEQRQSTIVRQTKQPGVALPYTARSPAVPASPHSPAGRRLQVAGREVDAGPLGGLSDEGHGHGLLPPAYEQATQPLPGQRQGVNRAT